MRRRVKVFITLISLIFLFSLCYYTLSPTLQPFQNSPFVVATPSTGYPSGWLISDYNLTIKEYDSGGGLLNTWSSPFQYQYVNSSTAEFKLVLTPQNSSTATLQIDLPKNPLIITGITNGGLQSTRISTSFKVSKNGSPITINGYLYRWYEDSVFTPRPYFDELFCSQTNYGSLPQTTITYPRVYDTDEVYAFYVRSVLEAPPPPSQGYGFTSGSWGGGDTLKTRARDDQNYYMDSGAKWTWGTHYVKMDILIQDIRDPAIWLPTTLFFEFEGHQTATGSYTTQGSDVCVYDPVSFLWVNLGPSGGSDHYYNYTFSYPNAGLHYIWGFRAYSDWCWNLFYFPSSVQLYLDYFKATINYYNKYGYARQNYVNSYTDTYNKFAISYQTSDTSFQLWLAIGGTWYQYNLPARNTWEPYIISVPSGYLTQVRIYRVNEPNGQSINIGGMGLVRPIRVQLDTATVQYHGDDSTGLFGLIDYPLYISGAIREYDFLSNPIGGSQTAPVKLYKDGVEKASWNLAGEFNVSYYEASPFSKCEMWVEGNASSLNPNYEKVVANSFTVGLLELEDYWWTYDLVNPAYSFFRTGSYYLHLKTRWADCNCSINGNLKVSDNFTSEIRVEDNPSNFTIPFTFWDSGSFNIAIYLMDTNDTSIFKFSNMKQIYIIPIYVSPIQAEIKYLNFTHPAYSMHGSVSFTTGIYLNQSDPYFDAYIKYELINPLNVVEQNYLTPIVLKNNQTLDFTHFFEKAHWTEGYKVKVNLLATDMQLVSSSTPFVIPFETSFELNNFDVSWSCTEYQSIEPITFTFTVEANNSAEQYVWVYAYRVVGGVPDIPLFWKGTQLVSPSGGGELEAGFTFTVPNRGYWINGTDYIRVEFWSENEECLLTQNIYPNVYTPFLSLNTVMNVDNPYTTDLSFLTGSIDYVFSAPDMKPQVFMLTLHYGDKTITYPVILTCGAGRVEWAVGLGLEYPASITITLSNTYLGLSSEQTIPLHIQKSTFAQALEKIIPYLVWLKNLYDTAIGQLIIGFILLIIMSVLIVWVIMRWLYGEKTSEQLQKLTLFEGVEKEKLRLKEEGVEKAQLVEIEKEKITVKEPKPERRRIAPKFSITEKLRLKFLRTPRLTLKGMGGRRLKFRYSEKKPKLKLKGG